MKVSQDIRLHLRPFLVLILLKPDSGSPMRSPNEFRSPLFYAVSSTTKTGFASRWVSGDRFERTMECAKRGVYGEVFVLPFAADICAPAAVTNADHSTIVYRLH